MFSERWNSGKHKRLKSIRCGSVQRVAHLGCAELGRKAIAANGLAVLDAMF